MTNDGQINRSTTITVMQAYVAMFKYLEHLQQLTGSDDLASFLGGMSLLADEQLTTDPAAWNDWIRAVTSVLQSPPDISLKITKK